MLVFLFALEWIDTYKLLTLGRVLRSWAWAARWRPFATPLIRRFTRPASCRRPFGRGPVRRPSKKSPRALYIAWLLRSNRVGFMVDTAISGFAVGAGFAVIENLTYVPDLSGSGLIASAIRGLGTAMMHGGATAIFGTVSANLSEIRGSRSVLTFLPGLAMAMFIHELYNQPLWRPVFAAVVVLVTLPAIIAFIFWRSEKVLEKWLGMKLDKDIDLLQMIADGNLQRVAAWVPTCDRWSSTFTPAILGDMLSYLHLSLELSARAKGDLLRREMGFPLTPDPELAGQFKELKFLEVAHRPRRKNGPGTAVGPEPPGHLGTAKPGGENGVSLAAG